MKFLIAIMFAFVTLTSSFASSLESPPEQVKCDEAKKICTYVSQNITARVLLSRINSIMFPGSILTPEEGFLNVETLKKLNFWIEDENFRARFITLLPVLDSFEEFNPSALIQLTTEIYSVSEKGFKHINAEVTSATSSAEEATNFVLSSLGGGTVDLALKLGSNLLGSILGTRIAREEVTQVETVTQLIPNLSGVNFSHGSTVFISPTTGSVKEVRTGLDINGTVSINKFDSELVLVKDYSLTYGVTNKVSDGNVIAPVTILSISNPQLYLVKDTATMVVSTHTEIEEAGREWGFGLFGRNSSKTRTKLMVITRATAFSFNEYIRELKELRKLELHRSFSESAVNSFPAGEVSLKRVLKSVTPYALQTPSGQKILGFKLNKDLARPSNIKKSIEIKIRGGGIKQSAILPLESLMLSGIKLDSIKSKYLDKKVVKLKIELRPFKGSFSSKVKLKLYYNPRTNKFIQE